MLWSKFKSKSIYTSRIFAFLLENYKKYNIYENKYPFHDFLTNGCGASSYYFYSISSNGEIYRCPSDLGNKQRAILNLNNSDFINNKISIEYSEATNPFDDKICSECFLLYSCLGGCRRKLFLSQKNKGERDCHPYKFYTKEHLDNYYTEKNK